ncbi:MAG: ABC transporter permease [Myxococcales bacterium]|nr:ABC transporter permease [Myxococcota bacterium]MDW8282744.1 ABC transporter permease [Myxococcales bacterium]
MWLMAVRLALRALSRNRLRSALTALGVIIGVAALIITVALGEGARRLIEQQIASLGSSMLIVIPGASTTGGFVGGAGSGRPLLREDVDEILRLAPAVRYAAPVDRTVAQVVSANLNWSCQVLGTTPDYFLIRDWAPARGRLFTASENETAAKVCLLGQTVAHNLFGSADPVGEMVRIKQMPCEVIGVLAPKGQSAMGTDQDDVVIVPALTLRTRLLNQSRQHVGTIVIAATSEQDLPLAEQQVVQVLRMRHKLADDQDNDFTIRNLSELMQTQQRVVQTNATMLRNVAAVSLLVGGIGIMNIMLVSVTERTREIGVRLAIGARERDILRQFLVEAVVLSVSGGLLGLALGTGGAHLLSSFLDGLSVEIPAFWVLMALGISIAIGVSFGFYPARRAARLDPIEALRHE